MSNISGAWEGNYYGVTSFISKPQKLVVDLMVYQDTLIIGSSHLYYGNGNYEHYTISGVYRPQDSTIFFSEDSTLAVRLSLGASNCLGNYTMKLKMTDTAMRFDGKWKDNSTGFFLFRCPSSRVYLERKLPRLKTFVQKEKVQEKPPDRKPDIQSLIEVKQEDKDSIRIELLDNARIDHDVVSVYLNDSLIIHKKKLAAEPEVFYISLEKETSICRLKIVAESMGSMPPCTALMRVSTKNNRYDVELSSDFGKSGVLELFLHE